MRPPNDVGLVDDVSGLVAPDDRVAGNPNIADAEVPGAVDDCDGVGGGHCGVPRSVKMFYQIGNGHATTIFYQIGNEHDMRVPARAYTLKIVRRRAL
jgi:hypothetical protein